MSGPKYINPWSQFVGCFLPNWLLERPELSLGAKVTYARLAQFAGRKGVAIVRRHVLAAKLATSERSVGTYLTELIDNGLIKGTRPGLGRPNQYRFLAHDWMQFRDERDEGDIPDRQDLPIRNGKTRRSGTGDVADPSNDKNLRQEKGATAPDSLSGEPSLFRAEGLSEGSPESHGFPHPPGPPAPPVAQNGQHGNKSETAEIVQRVFSGRQRSTDHPAAKLTDSRARKVTGRLREGFTPEQLLCVVTEAWQLDPWHERKDNNDLIILLRDGSQVEKFLELHRKAKPTANGSSGNGAGRPVDEEKQAREAREFNARQDALQQAARSTQGAHP